LDIERAYKIWEQLRKVIDSFSGPYPIEVMKANFQQNILDLASMIPDELKDERYREEMEKAMMSNDKYAAHEANRAIMGLLWRCGYWQIKNIDRK